MNGPDERSVIDLTEAIPAAVRSWIASTDDDRVLNRLATIIKDHRQALGYKRWKARCDEAWTRYRRLKAGMTVWCCASGTFLGGPLQRGDKAVVEYVQPRARRLWLKIKGNRCWFGEAESTRYDFRTVAPPPNTEEQERMNRIASRLGDVLK